MTKNAIETIQQDKGWCRNYNYVEDYQDKQILFSFSFIHKYIIRSSLLIVQNKGTFPQFTYTCIYNVLQ